MINKHAAFIGISLLVVSLTACGEKTHDTSSETQVAIDVIETEAVVETTEVLEGIIKEPKKLEGYKGEVYLLGERERTNTEEMLNSDGKISLKSGTYIVGYDIPVGNYYLYTANRPDVTCITLKEHNVIQPGNQSKDEISGKFESTLRLEENAALTLNQDFELEPIGSPGILYDDYDMAEFYFESLSPVDMLSLARAYKHPDIRGTGVLIGQDNDIWLVHPANGSDLDVVAIRNVSNTGLAVGDEIEYIGELTGTYKSGKIYTGFIVAEVEKGK